MMRSVVLRWCFQCRYDSVRKNKGSSWGLRAELEGYCGSGLLLHQRQYVKVRNYIAVDHATYSPPFMDQTQTMFASGSCFEFFQLFCIHGFSVRELTELDFKPFPSSMGWSFTEPSMCNRVSKNKLVLFSSTVNDRTHMIGLDCLLYMLPTKCLTEDFERDPTIAYPVMIGACLMICVEV
ncbi:LOW QUALITY PROTEIN: hypothetical protein NC652_011128 [Populus alba x Populus x berolinensis]|nr:LOW QUALITY PROTEIN: hypothetical protein NC652_011128 [Populus alba x Populus x berolinensis]